MIRTVSNLEVLIHCHVSPLRHSRIDCAAVSAGLKLLLQEELIEPTELVDVYETTEKGKFYLSYLLTTPFPESQYIIPERQS